MKRQILLFTFLISLTSLISCSGDNDNKLAQADLSQSGDKPFVADTSSQSSIAPKKVDRQIETDLGTPIADLPDSVKALLYWPGGKMRSQSIYFDEDDTTSWRTRMWAKDGQLIRQFEVHDNQRTGPAFSWREDGTKESESHLLNGKLEGECLYFDSSGVKDQLVTYKAGVRDGKFENYFPDGSIKKRGYFSNDKLEGEYTAWYNSGQIEYKGQYGNDLMQGDWTKYHPNGNVKATSVYKDGERNGPYKVYTPEDEYLLTDQVYENGVMVKDNKK